MASSPMCTKEVGLLFYRQLGAPGKFKQRGDVVGFLGSSS